MKKILEINDCFVDTDKISFIGKVDTQPKPHLNTVLYALKLIVDGSQIEIVFHSVKEAESARRILISEIGAALKPEFIGLLPS